MKNLSISLLMIALCGLLANAQLYPKDYDKIDFAFDSLYSVKYQNYMRTKDSLTLIQLYESLNNQINQAETTTELIITNSTIHSLPLGIEKLTKVEKVVFGNCKNLDVEKVLDQLAVLPALKNLAITNCRLYQLPENIKNLSQLERLSLKENRIVRLPNGLVELKNLSHLNVSNNSILNEDLLFELLKNMPQIKYLEANYCAIRSLPILGISNLQSLSLAGNLLKELNRELKVETLDLSGNPYLEVEKTIEQLSSNKALKTLNFGFNKWTSLPANIQLLSSLESLNLRGNNLVSLPDEIASLSNLRVLKVDNPDTYLHTNKLTSLPSGIGRLSKLDSLFLSGNLLQNLPSSFNKLSNLTYLDLSWNKLESFPKALLSLEQLQHLNLAINHIKVIPEEIGSLDQLNYLNCQGDFFVNYQLKIKEIPNSIGQLISLESLILSDNVIEEIPASIGTCINLKHIDFKDNLLSTLPENIGNLNQLSTLNLKANELTDLPSSTTQLDNLKTLDLSFNFNINSASAAAKLKDLKQLKTLNIADCYFSDEAVKLLQESLINTEIITQLHQDE